MIAKPSLSERITAVLRVALENAVMLLSLVALLAWTVFLHGSCPDPPC